MKRMKTFLKYAIWIILFFILSEVLINASLKGSYKDITRKDNIQQVEIVSAEATNINGKVKGTIRNSKQDYLTGKYLKIDFYSKRDNIVGTKYILIQTTEATKTQDFEVQFELNEVTSYEMSIVEEKTTGDTEFTINGLTSDQLFIARWALLLTL